MTEDLRAAACRLLGWLETSPDGLHGLLCRWGIAAIFWRSGQTKVNGWSINETTFDLFRDEYRVPLLHPEFAAISATLAEHLFPVLLVVGLASRLSAGALLVMTLVIQCFVYPGSWPDHLLWASALVYVLLRGPGAVSLDHLIRRAQPRFRRA